MGQPLTQTEANRMSEEFTPTLQHLLQAKGGKLRSKARMVDQKGSEKKAHDRIGAFSMEERDPTGSRTKITRADYNRRWLQTVTYTLHVLVSDVDDLRAATGNPNAAIMQEMVMAARRNEDVVSTRALLGQAEVGRNGGVFVDLPAANTVAAGGVGLTVEKMITAHDNLTDTHAIMGANGMEAEAHLCVSTRQASDLLYSVQFNSSDHNNVKPLTSGGSGTYMGFDIEKLVDNKETNTTFLPLNSGIRDCIAFSPMAFDFAERHPIQVEINKRPDMQNDWQISIKQDIGACRFEEGRVQKIQCLDQWTARSTVNAAL